MMRADRGNRRLFRDLAGLLGDGRDRSLAALEEAIEARFRRYLDAVPTPSGDTLTVTLSWQLPEGASSWALYATEFRIEARGLPAAAPPSSAGGNVIPFPARPATAAPLRAHPSLTG